VKSYAVDYCGAKSLRESTREQVEAFVVHLADWAEKDRNALLQILAAPLCGIKDLKRRRTGRFTAMFSRSRFCNKLCQRTFIEN
jgi:hypothetical protein